MGEAASAGSDASVGGRRAPQGFDSRGGDIRATWRATRQAAGRPVRHERLAQRPTLSLLPSSGTVWAPSPQHLVYTYLLGIMVRSTIIVRATDALPLAATVDDEQVCAGIKPGDNAAHPQLSLVDRTTAAGT